MVFYWLQPSGTTPPTISLSICWICVLPGRAAENREIIFTALIVKLEHRRWWQPRRFGFGSHLEIKELFPKFMQSAATENRIL